LRQITAPPLIEPFLAPSLDPLHEKAIAGQDNNQAALKSYRLSNCNSLLAQYLQHLPELAGSSQAVSTRGNRHPEWPEDRKRRRKKAQEKTAHDTIERF
jgi:hypothetical protein